MAICKHFGICGGCALQDLSPDAYSARKQAMVRDALARVGLDNVTVEAPLIVPPASRRRAIFKFGKIKDGVDVGFHAARSHSIVDMHQCLVLTPDLFALAQILRTALAPILGDGEKGEVHVTETETGFDLAFRWDRKLTSALTTALGQALGKHDVARIMFNADIILERGKPEILFDGARVTPPPLAFLQATREGEAALQQHVLALTAGAKNIADLFAGLGTFTLPLARKARVHAVEQDGAALQALAEAARTATGLRPVTTEKRDLFKRPLGPAELKPFDAVVLDPPRAGAEAQIRALAASTVSRVAPKTIVYVSCDAGSFARDAAILAGAGFVPGAVTPIDQFLFSLHIELVAGFTRGGRRR